MNETITLQDAQKIILMETQGREQLALGELLTAIENITQKYRVSVTAVPELLPDGRISSRLHVRSS